jgi:hypothetical protein
MTRVKRGVYDTGFSNYSTIQYFFHNLTFFSILVKLQVDALMPSCMPSLQMSVGLRFIFLVLAVHTRTVQEDAMWCSETSSKSTQVPHVFSRQVRPLSPSHLI